MTKLIVLEKKLSLKNQKQVNKLIFFGSPSWLELRVTDYKSVIAKFTFTLFDNKAKNTQ